MSDEPPTDAETGPLMPDEFLTVAEIAQFLKLTEHTIRNWIDTGKLPAYRVGRRLRVRRGDLDAFMQRVVEDEQVVTVPGARASLDAALRDAYAADTDAELAAALRSVARAANGLARAFEQQRKE